MHLVSYDILTRCIRLLGNLPAIPSILRTLTDALSIEAIKIDVDKVVEEISYDKSLISPLPTSGQFSPVPATG